MKYLNHFIENEYLKENELKTAYLYAAAPLLTHS